MFVRKSTHASIVADLKDEISRLNHRLNAEERRSGRLAAENVTLRSGGPRGEGGKFVKRVAG